MNSEGRRGRDDRAPGIYVENVTKTYFGETVLRAGIDDGPLFFELGKRHVLFGVSGSGKSTLLNIIGLLDVPDLISTGKNGKPPRLSFVTEDDVTEVTYHRFGWFRVRARVQVFDRHGKALGGPADPASLRRRLFSFIFQSSYFHPSLKNRRNAELPLFATGRVPASEDAATAWFDHFGLENRVENLPEQCSGGERQRAAVIRACLGVVSRRAGEPPRIILADEPTSSLDEPNAKLTLARFDALVRQLGATLIWVTHSAAQKTAMADTVTEFDALHRAQRKQDFMPAHRSQSPAPAREDETAQLQNMATQDWGVFGVFRFMMLQLGVDLFGKARPRQTVHVPPPNPDDKAANNSKPPTRGSRLMHRLYAWRFSAIAFVAVVMTMAFLLTMVNLKHYASDVAQARFADPRVNNLQIEHVNGSINLSQNTITYLKELLGPLASAIEPRWTPHLSYQLAAKPETTSKPAPVRLGRPARVRKTRRPYRIMSNVAGFSRNDILVARILAHEPDIPRAFLSGPAEGAHLNAILIREGKYLNDIRANLKLADGAPLTHLNLAYNTCLDRMAVYTTKSDLPNGAFAILRTDYIHGCQTGHKDSSQSARDAFEKANLTGINIYPSDGEATGQIIARIQVTPGHGLVVVDPHGVSNRLSLVKETQKGIESSLLIGLIGMAVLATIATILLVMQSIERRRRELSVFLAFGISRWVITAAYALESLLIAALSLLVAVVGFQWLGVPAIEARVRGADILQPPVALVEGTVAQLPLEISRISIAYGAGVGMVLIAIYCGIVLWRLRLHPSELLRSS